MKPTSLSLIFVNFRSASLLEQAVRSWEAPLQNIDHEILVINNDIDEVAALDALAAHCPIAVWHLPENLGFAAACNYGAERAIGHILFFLNPDTRYMRGSVEELLALFDRYPQSLGGVQLVDKSGRPEKWSAGKFPTLGRLLKQNLFGTDFIPAWRRRHFAYIDWVSGAALLIPRTVFWQVAGFDDQFFLYFEDVDLARRAANQGIGTWRFPQLTVQHAGGASQHDGRRQKQQYRVSQKRYFLKHRPCWEGKVVAMAQYLIG